MRKIIYFCIGGVLISGCERDRLSPVEIKIDDDVGYTAVGNIALGASHIVSDNETLFDIANKYNVDPMNLAEINEIKAPYNVKNGQALKLPTENFPIAELSAEIEKSEKEKNQDADKLERELDEEFAGVMSVKGKHVSESPKKNSFNEQENALLTPKITKTATGTELPDVKKQPVLPPTPGKMIYPVKGKVISVFGDVKDGVSNDGINIKAAAGTPVKAASDGEVIYTGNKLEEFGNTVIVKHDNDIITSYAHLRDINIKNGAAVRRGDIIGSVGKTGDVTEPQLHFEVLKNKMPINPSKYLD
jgi:murein DD-endopeptidase MepM/ murein hydrolase activator NlpD